MAQRAAKSDGGGRIVAAGTVSGAVVVVLVSIIVSFMTDEFVEDNVSSAVMGF